jgi:hypothetical protein
LAEGAKKLFSRDLRRPAGKGSRQPPARPGSAVNNKTTIKIRTHPPTPIFDVSEFFA